MMTILIVTGLLMIFAVSGSLLVCACIGYVDYLLERRRELSLLKGPAKRRDGL
ncbi:MULTISPECIES: hypothetical protein [unclassified Rhizobium]|uniref:hypothetical protein n=1 Tax=unclassified Rhizobium TaxID=2613769 RepID=UPI0013C4AD00|nr:MULTISPECIES: hypothetical protein [unclassified Rhizobium]